MSEAQDALGRDLWSPSESEIALDTESRGRPRDQISSSSLRRAKEYVVDLLSDGLTHRYSNRLFEGIQSKNSYTVTFFPVTVLRP